MDSFSELSESVRTNIFALGLDLLKRMDFGDVFFRDISGLSGTSHDVVNDLLLLLQHEPQQTSKPVIANEVAQNDFLVFGDVEGKSSSFFFEATPLPLTLKISASKHLLDNDILGNVAVSSAEGIHCLVNSCSDSKLRAQLQRTAFQLAVVSRNLGLLITSVLEIVTSHEEFEVVVPPQSVSEEEILFVPVGKAVLQSRDTKYDVAMFKNNMWFSTNSELFEYSYCSQSFKCEKRQPALSGFALLLVTDSSVFYWKRLSRSAIQVAEIQGQLIHKSVVRGPEKSTLCCCASGNELVLVGFLDNGQTLYDVRSINSLLGKSEIELARPRAVSFQTNARAQQRSILFAGSSISIGKFSLKVQCEPLTVELWVFPEAVDEHQALFSHGDKSVDEVLIELIPTDVGICVRGGSRSPHLGSIFVSTEVVGSSLLGRWTHIALTFSGTTWRLLVNGDTVDTNNLGGPLAGVSESSCVLGKQFAGFMSEVRVWSYCRSEADVCRDMYRGLNGNESGLIGYFPLHEESGLVLQDGSKNHCHALVARLSYFSALPTAPPVKRNASLVSDNTLAFLARNTDVAICSSSNSVVLAFTFEATTMIVEFSKESSLLWRRIVTQLNVAKIVCDSTNNIFVFSPLVEQTIQVSKLDAFIEWLPCGSWKSALQASDIALLRVCQDAKPRHWAHPSHLCSLLELAWWAHSKKSAGILKSCKNLLSWELHCLRGCDEADLGDPYTDCNQLLPNAQNLKQMTARSVLEWLCFHDETDTSLLQAALPWILSEKAITLAISRYCARNRSQAEDTLFIAVARYVSSAGKRSTKLEKLLLVAKSLLSEVQFQLVQAMTKRQLCLTDVNDCLIAVHDLVVQNVKNDVQSSSVVVYCSQLLKHCERALIHGTNLTRNDRSYFEEVNNAMRASFVGRLLPVLLLSLGTFPTSVISAIMSSVESCRDAVSTAVSVFGPHGWLADLRNQIIVESATLASVLIKQGDENQNQSVNSSPFQQLFRGGFRKNGTPRDTFVRNIFQGVGIVSRIIAEIQHDDMPLRSPDHPLVHIERVMLAAFANILLDNAAVANPTKETLLQVFRHVKALRPWVLSRKQEDCNALAKVEAKSVFLSKLDPCLARMQPVSDSQSTTNTTKKWRRMFQQWKQMRHIKIMLSMLGNRVSKGSDTAALIATFFQSETATCYEIERLLLSRSQKAHDRQIGYTVMKTLVEEGRLHSGVDGLIHTSVCATTAGWHYLNHLSGCASESLVRLRGAFFQLHDEIVRRMETQKSTHVSRMFLAVLAAPWAAGDFSRLHPNVLTTLCRCVEEGCSDHFFGHQMLNRDSTQIQLETLRRADCGGSVVCGLETPTLRGTGNRGAYICPVSWTRGSSSVQYFEISVIELAANAAVSIGLGPETFAPTRPLGWDSGSYALHSDDGVLFAESSNGRQTGVSFGVGDTIGCGWRGDGEIFWTKNGKLLSITVPSSADVLCPLVGIDGRSVVTINFGSRPTEHSIRPSPGSAAMSRQLHDSAFDVLRCFVFRCAEIIEEKHTDESASAIQSIVKFLQSFFDNVCLLLTKESTDRFAGQMCDLVHQVARRVGGAQDLTFVIQSTSLLDALCEIQGRTNSYRVACSALSALAAVMQFYTESELTKHRCLSMMFEAARGAVWNPLTFEWTSERMWTSMRALQRVNCGMRTPFQEVLSTMIIKALESSDKHRQRAALAILGGYDIVPRPGDMVDVRTAKGDTQTKILVACNVHDEVCEVIDQQTRKVHFVSLNAISRVSQKLVFPQRDNDLHVLQAQALARLASRVWQSSGEIESSLTGYVHAGLVKLMLACVEAKLALTPSLNISNLLNWTPLSRHTDRPLAQLHLEDCIASALLVQHDSTAAVHNEKTDRPQTSPQHEHSAVGSIDEARTHMAQELSMRGFSLEMCMIALEETHYDRAAALRLLTDHHDDLLRVLHNEEEEEDEGSEEEAPSDDEENQEDSEGDNSASDSNTSCLSQQSKVSQSSHEGIRFDGSGILRVSSESTVGPQFTLDFWMRPQDVDTAQIVLLQRATTESTLFVLIEKSRLQFGWGKLDRSTVAGVCSMQLSDGDPTRWTRITCVQDCSDLSLYKNGILKDSAVAPLAESLLASELHFGGTSDCPELSGFMGDVKDIRIFESALPQDVVESMFSLTQAPTASASSPHLVIHLRCDDGRFPMQNSSASVNCIAVTTVVQGSVLWLSTEVEQQESLHTQAEVDFTSQNDHEDSAVLDMSVEHSTFIPVFKRLRSMSGDELVKVHINVCKDIIASYACRIALHELEHCSSSGDSVGWAPAHARLITSFALRSRDEELIRDYTQLLLDCVVASRDSAFVDGCLHQLVLLVDHSQKVMSFESAHPCKGLTDTPIEVHAASHTVYSVFFDQRCSTHAMLLTVYADQQLGTVAAQYASGVLSSFRVKGPRFYFDVRIDGTGPQWGYKMYVIYDDCAQLAAARILRSVVMQCLRSGHSLPSLFTSASVLESLAHGALVNSGKCRRLLLAILTDALRSGAVPGSAIEALRLQEIRKMAEKQYRREVGLHMHSKFIQVCAEYFVALKDAELARSAPVHASDDQELDKLDAKEEWKRFASTRSEQKRQYLTRYREGKDRVGVERVRFPDHVRIEQNLDKTIAVWSERSGCSVMGDVALNAGMWYFEVRMVATADVSIGVVSSSCDHRSGQIERGSVWMYNGHSGALLDCADSSASESRRWKGRDVIGVVIDCTERCLRFYVNGTVTATSVVYRKEQTSANAAMAARSAEDSNYASDESGVHPYFVLAADEGILINFGGTHFEFDLPVGALPLDPSQLSLGTLIPFNHVRAFEDIVATVTVSSISTLPPYLVDEADPFENPAHRSGPPHVSLVSSPDVYINILEARNDGTAFSTVCGDCTVYKGRWYYEVTLMSQGLMQIGWLSSQDGPGVTVGDSPLSWGFDGFRRQRWNNRTAVGVGITRRWIAGDVVGCSLDLEAGRVTFSLNGRHVIDGHFVLKSIPPNTGFVPAASLRSGNFVSFNFGSSSLKFKPETYSALGVPDTWDERIDTFYTTVSATSLKKRLQTARSAFLWLTENDNKRLLRRPSCAVLQSMVEHVNDSCKKSGKTFLQIPTDKILQDFSSAALDPSVSIEKCFDVLKAIARIAQSAIPLMHVNGVDRDLGDALVRAARGFLFASVREQMVSSILRETNCRTEHFRLTINRHRAREGRRDKPENTIFGQTFDLLHQQSPRMFKTSKRMWSVVFLGEGAEDVGGPYREHLSELCNELMSTALSLFLPTPNQVNNVGSHRDAHIPNPDATAPLQLRMFTFLGRLMGGAARSGEPLNLTLPPLFWKLLLKEIVVEDDIFCVDHACGQCLRELRDMKAGCGSDGRDMFDETFETETFTTQLSSGRTVELIDNGHSVALTYDRCEEYVLRLGSSRLFESAVQIRCIREGLVSVVPELVLSLLTPSELELRVCGTPDYTVQALKESTTYEGVTSEDKRVLHLWQVLEEATPLQRRLFLKFVSGRERMPIQLRVLPMVTQGDPNNSLPRAATCFFAIELPEYSSVDVLREKLLYAIENCLDIDTDFRARDVEEQDGPQLIVGVETRHDESVDQAGADQ